MKTKLFNLFAASFAVLSLAAGCQEKPVSEENLVEDASITVTPNKVEATWEEGVYAVSVESNCEWTITKTDSEGVEVDWVQTDVSKGKDNMAFNILVVKNTTVERAATVTLTCGEVKAFIDVVQEANPTPVIPDPEPVLHEYYFEFAGAALDWPTQGGETASWAGLYNLNSGLAIDLGTETDNPENLRRKAQVKYALDGVDYWFTFADPHCATAHQIYLVPEGVHCGGYRYFGLPAIEGQKLVKIEMVQAASDKDATYERLVGVTEWVYDVEDTKAQKLTYVDGGEPQYQNTNMGTYTYELNETAGNTVYYLAHPSKAGRIHSLRLFYAEVTGNEPAPTPEPDPVAKPEEPEEPKPEIPEPENKVVHTFDFTCAPLPGWPITKHEHIDGGTPCIYPLDGVDYTFMLADCDGASACQTFWSESGYLALNAQYRYLGLPVIEGYKLFRVTCINAKLIEDTKGLSPKIGVTKLITTSAAAPADTDFVTGGEYQTWKHDGGETYTYTLPETEANKIYYIYAQVKGAIATLELTYVPVTE